LELQVIIYYYVTFSEEKTKKMPFDIMLATAQLIATDGAKAVHFVGLFGKTASHMKLPNHMHAESHTETH